MPMNIYLHSMTKPSSSYIHSWTFYATYSTVNGVNFCCFSRRPKLVQYIGISFMIICALCSMCMVAQNVSLYMRKSVVNSIKIRDEDQIDFPAITICNQLITTRVPACDFPDFGQFEQFLSMTPKLEAWPWTDSLRQEVSYRHLNVQNEHKLHSFYVHLFTDQYAKYCPCPQGYKKRTANEGFEDFQRKDYYEIVNEYIPSIDEQFAYCEMNRKNLGCGDIFGGHLTDIGLCMTFNMIHSEAINTQVDSIGKFGGLSAAAKGENYRVNQSGPESGLKVVLRTRKMDYCGSLRKWTGIGFHIAIHQENNVVPLHFLSNFRFKFHPGYFYHIGLRVTTMIRNTEHLNRCTSKAMMLGGFSTGVSYDRPVCLITCLFRLVYRKCHCFTRIFESMRAVITTENMDLATINMSTPWCRSTHEMDFCELMEIVQWRNDDFQRDNCTSCPPPCMESQYGTTITETKINHWFISTNEAISNETIDDLVVANFYLESMSVTYIYEDQAFTFEDLVTYVANILNLFFGMSFLTMFELLLEVVLSIHSKFSSFMHELYHQ